MAAYLRDLGPSDFVPKPPPGVSVSLSAVDDTSDTLPPVDDALRQMIQELASRADFGSEEAQRELRNLVTRAVHDHIVEPEVERSVRQRQDGNS